MKYLINVVYWFVWLIIFVVYQIGYFVWNIKFDRDCNTPNKLIQEFNDFLHFTDSGKIPTLY
jgi:hypothetical protein